MDLPEATAYLRRYQAWRRASPGQSLTAGGFDSNSVNQSIDIILNATNEIKTLRQDLASARSKLRKAQVQREKFHSQLRSNQSSS